MTTDIKNTLANKLWRLQNIYKIRDKNKNLITFKLNNIQNIIYNDIKDQIPIRHYIIKSRQVGISTFFILWWLDDTIFHKNTITGILAHKWESLHHLWGIIDIAIRHLPEQLKPQLSEDTKHSLYFEQIESRIFISLSIRSTGIHNLHISEWCFCKDNEVRTTLGAISPNTNVTGESTGNGIANDGYITYQEAKLKENEYKPLFFPWFFQEEYQLPIIEHNPQELLDKLKPEEKQLKKLMIEKYQMELKPEQLLWRRQAQKRLKDIFRQEYPETDEDAFITSGMHYFNVEKIMALLKEARLYYNKNKYQEEADRYICFELPQAGNVYCAGADTSEGVNDYCVLKIINVTKRRESFIFRSRCGVKTFYKQCDYWCRKYNNALLAVENNFPGNAVLLGLSEDCRYPNLYEQRETTRVLSKMTDKPKVKLGWQTTSASRNLMLTEFKYFIEDEDDVDVNNFAPEYSIYDMELLKEMLTFINNDGKYEAEQNKNDDIIFASAIATQVYKILRPKHEHVMSASSSNIEIGNTFESANF
jgi:hypothetical protein